MQVSWLIFKNYFRRAVIDPLGVIMLTLFPIGMIFLNVYVFNANSEPVLMNGYDVAATNVSVLIIVMFQFFGGMYINEWIFEDFRGSLCWRLFSAPVSQNKFFFSAAAASWLINVVQGMIIVAVTGIFLNAYWGNYIFWIVTIFLLSAISQLMYINIALFAKTKKMSEAIGHIIIFSMAIMSGALIGLGETLQQILIKIPTPMNAGTRVIFNSSFIGDDMSSAAANLLILLAYIAAFAVIAVIAGTRKGRKT